MNITLSTPLTVAGHTFATIKVGVFDVESDRFADAHVLNPPALRVLPLWRGGAYTAKTEWTSADVVARVNALNEEGKTRKVLCAMSDAKPFDTLLTPFGFAGLLLAAARLAAQKLAGLHDMITFTPLTAP